jgi:hypothetical protein
MATKDSDLVVVELTPRGVLGDVIADKLIRYFARTPYRAVVLGDDGKLHFAQLEEPQEP